MKSNKVYIPVLFVVITAIIVAVSIIYFQDSTAHEGRKREQSSIKCDSDNTDKYNVHVTSCQINKLDDIFHFEGIVSNGSKVPVAYIELKLECDTDKGEQKEFTIGSGGENKTFDVIKAGEKSIIVGQMESIEILSSCRAEVANLTNYYQTIQ